MTQNEIQAPTDPRRFPIRPTGKIGGLPCFAFPRPKTLYCEPCTRLTGACRRAPFLGSGLPRMRTSEVEPRSPFSVSSPSSARLAALIEISRLLTSAVDLDHLLSLILKTSSQLVGDRK